MQKLIVNAPTGSRTTNKRAAVTIATVLLSGALLWLTATKTTNPAITMNPAQVSVNEANPQRLKHNGQIEEQIIITHADSARVAKEAAAYQEFKREIALSTQEIDNSDARVNGVVERLTSLKACLFLTYFMAKDVFTGGSEVDKIFITAAENLDRITGDSVNNAKAAVDRLHSALHMTEGSYTETYIAGPERRSVTASDQSQLDLTRAVSFDSSLGSGSAILSATALTKTFNRSTWNLFGAMEKKATKRMAVAALPAVVDGPLPMGDIVTLALESACLVWSFNEVYEAQGVIKNDLQSELTGVMRQNSKQIREWAMTVGNELMEVAVAMPTSKIVTKTRK